MPQQRKKSNKRPDTPLASSPNPADKTYIGMKDAWGNPIGGAGNNTPFNSKPIKNKSKK